MAAAVNVIFGLVGALELVPTLEHFFAPSDADATTVRVTLGFGPEEENIQGNTPGVALWDDFGGPIGASFGSSKILNRGSFTDIKVHPNPGVGNVGAAYMSITNGGDDAICVAGASVTFPSGEKDLWSADIAGACSNVTGALVYHSQQTPTGTPDDKVNSTFCVWIDRDASNGIPHQGFGVRLPDVGALTTQAQLDRYNNDSALLCESGPRFRMYQELQTEDPILVFDPLIQKNDDGTDIDRSKIVGNPGVFAKQDFIALGKACDSKKAHNCDKLPKATPVSASHKRTDRQGLPQYRKYPRRYLEQKESNFNQSAAADTPSATVLSNNSSLPSSGNTAIRKGKDRFHGHCIISHGHQSAKLLCEHPNTWGPSFAAVKEGLFCDMADKQLYPICEQTTTDESSISSQKRDIPACFELSTQSLTTPPVSTTPDNLNVNDVSRAGVLSASPSTSGRNFTVVQYW